MSFFSRIAARSSRSGAGQSNALGVAVLPAVRSWSPVAEFDQRFNMTPTFAFASTGMFGPLGTGTSLDEGTTGEGGSEAGFSTGEQVAPLLAPSPTAKTGRGLEPQPMAARSVREDGRASIVTVEPAGLPGKVDATYVLGPSERQADVQPNPPSGQARDLAGLTTIQLHSEISGIGTVDVPLPQSVAQHAPASLVDVVPTTMLAPLARSQGVGGSAEERAQVGDSTGLSAPPSLRPYASGVANQDGPAKKINPGGKPETAAAPLSANAALQRALADVQAWMAAPARPAATPTVMGPKLPPAPALLLPRAPRDAEERGRVVGRPQTNAGPRLVIGRIDVEVIAPPPATVPTYVPERRQPSSGSAGASARTASISSHLTFGLRQR